MSERLRAARTGLLLVMLLFGAAPARAILHVADVTAGMRGYGKTVLSGTEITTFDVRVIDVVKSNGAVPDLILVKVGGPALEQVGGICAGMSGSPVYFKANGSADGLEQLAGAIGYTTPFADTTYGYVVPVDFLLPLLDWPAESGDPWTSARSGDDRNGMAWMACPSPGLRPTSPGGRGGSLLDSLVRVNAPVMVSGLPVRAFSQLGSRLASLRLNPVQGGGVASFDGSPAALKPGSSIGIQLTRGDVNVTAVGTLTHIDGERFVAFGHSFVHQGPAAFPLVATRVSAVIPSDELPFKLASPATQIAGTVTQDRQSGVGGVLGSAPAMTKVTVEATGEHLAQPMKLSAEVVRDPELTGDLIGAVVLGAIDGLVDREGLGSVEVTCAMRLGTGRTITRSDIVDSATDIGGYAGLEVKDTVATLDRNPFAPAGITAVDVKLQAHRRPATATILSATAQPEAVVPGQDIQVRVVVQPFRQPVETHDVLLRIPGDARPGPAQIRVHAKATGALLRYDPWDEAGEPRSLDALLTALEQSGKRRSIVCDLITSPFDELLGGSLARGLGGAPLTRPSADLSRGARWEPPLPVGEGWGEGRTSAAASAGAAMVPVQPQGQTEHALPERPTEPSDSASRQMLSLFDLVARATVDTDHVPTGEIHLPVRILRP